MHWHQNLIVSFPQSLLSLDHAGGPEGAQAIARIAVSGARRMDDEEFDKTGWHRNPYAGTNRIRFNGSFSATVRGGVSQPPGRAPSELA